MRVLWDVIEDLVVTFDNGFRCCFDESNSQTVEQPAGQLIKDQLISNRKLH